MHHQHQRRRVSQYNIIFWIIIISVTTETIFGHSPGQSEWSYSDTKQWSKNHKECGGKNQSPIDIETQKLVIDNSMRIERHFYEHAFKSASIVNNGHTAQIKLTVSDERFRPYITGSALNNEQYVFEQLHFHWSVDRDSGSEHAINGKHYAMEMHLVHWNKKYGNISNAVDESDGLAVLGVLFEITRKSNWQLNPTIDALQKITKLHASAEITQEIDLDNFLPNNIDLFYKYKGSLTTPPCFESVTWILFPEPNNIGLKQIEAFRKLQDNHKDSLGHTFRDIQNINERTVYASEDSGAFSLNSLVFNYLIIVSLFVSTVITVKEQNFLLN